MAPPRRAGKPVGEEHLNLRGHFTGVPGSLVIDWGNLWVVALPFLISASLSATFTILLWKASRKLIHHRLTCVNCIYEGALIRTHHCEEACAVNNIPSLPLLLFFFSAVFSMMALFFPDILNTYVLPLPTSQVLLGFSYSVVAIVSTGATVLVGVYLIQQWAPSRLLFLRIALVGTLFAILVSSSYDFAAEFVPIGLFAIALGMGVELRAQRGIPLLGMRALGLATLPLFVMALIGIVRIFQILSLV